MSALAVAGYSLATVGVITGLVVADIAINGFKFNFSETREQQAARVAKERLIALGGAAVLVGAGAYLALKTSHVDMGKGVMFGVGGIAALIAFDTAFPKALLARKEGT